MTVRYMSVKSASSGYRRVLLTPLRSLTIRVRTVIPYIPYLEMRALMITAKITSKGQITIPKKQELYEEG